MKNKLLSLFTLIELSRSQPQYGWALRGFSQNEQSNLAEHQYLVTFIAWQLATMVKSAGAKVDVLKVVEYALIHDLGELFGGDIAMPYAKVNPKAREAAKKFELENTKFLAQFFNDEVEYSKLTEEILDAKSDEALIAKVADYIELAYFIEYKDIRTQEDVELVFSSTIEKINKLTDQIARKELFEFVTNWKENHKKKNIFEILKEAKE